MAPDHTTELLPLASGRGFRRSHQGEAAGLVPSVTGATASAAGDLVGDPASTVPAQLEVTLQETTSSQPAFRLDSGVANNYMKSIKRFRVLVIGRPNAGKTTILQRVCKSTDEPEIFDGKGNKIEDTVVQGNETRGYHDTERELVFRSNPGFVFHDSCGFEAGSAEEFRHTMNFVADRAATRRVNERIHAIWFCIPLTDHTRTLHSAEREFFDECDTGHVPVIVVLTKTDALDAIALGEVQEEGLEMNKATIRERKGRLLEMYLARLKHECDGCRYPPRRYVTLEKMDEEDGDCTALIQSTANVMNAEDLQKLLISTQRSNILMCIEYAVRETLKRHMEIGLVGRSLVGVAELESTLLAWFPNYDVCLRWWKDWSDPSLELLEWSSPREWPRERDRLEWSPWRNLNELPKFNVRDDLTMPSWPKHVTLLGFFPTVQSMVKHAIGKGL